MKAKYGERVEANERGDKQRDKHGQKEEIFGNYMGKKPVLPRTRGVGLQFHILISFPDERKKAASKGREESRREKRRERGRGQNGERAKWEEREGSKMCQREGESRMQQIHVSPICFTAKKENELCQQLQEP